MGRAMKKTTFRYFNSLAEAVQIATSGEFGYVGHKGNMDWLLHFTFNKVGMLTFESSTFDSK